MWKAAHPVLASKTLNAELGRKLRAKENAGGYGVPAFYFDMRPSMERRICD